MKRAIGILLTVSVAALATEASAGGRRSGFSGWGVPTYHRAEPLHIPYNDHEKMTICDDRPVPPGWVIVGRRHSGICPGHGCNQLIIQRLSNVAGAEMNMCASQPVPLGWVVIAQHHSLYCPGHGTNCLRIQKL